MKERRELSKDQEQWIDWMQECVELSRRANSALKRNDLEAIESCLEAKAALLSRRPASKPPRIPLSGSTAQEVRTLNDQNRALVQNGFEFARTLLDVIRPPATYSSLGPGPRQPEGPDESSFSVKG